MKEYRIQGYYGTRYKWETVTTETNREDAEKQLQCYNENEPGTPHRIKEEEETV